MRDPVARLNEALSGRYRVESLLGEGGMATVYLARDLRHDRSVALKVLKPELAAVVGAERFLAEIRTTANLQHPHILPLFDSGEVDGILFYVMPYVEGESLRERLDRDRQLPVDEAVAIATDIAEALDYAHRQGVIHRDIKPANILLHDGKPVVSDFGIALAVTAGGAGRLTETGLSLGTPHYMSPEQATGDTRVGLATDIYALGCVLYEMLVGEPPYTGSTPQAILGRIIAGEGVSATKQRATVPAHVDAAVRKALEKVPADRFASAGDFAKALADRAFRHGEAVAPATSGGRPAWQAAALVTLGVALGVALGVGAMAVGSDRDDSATQAGVMRFALAGPGPDSLDTSTVGQDVAISRDGRMIAYVGRTEDGSATQIRVRPIDQPEAFALAGSEGGHNPIFSPDGRWVAFVDRADPRMLKRVAATGGAAETLATLPSEVPYIAGASWGVDDRIVIGTGASTGLFRVSVGSRLLEHISEGQHHWPAVIDGRDAVLIMQHEATMNLAVLDLVSGEVKLLGIEGTSPRYLPTGHLVYADPAGSIRGVRFDRATLQVVGTPVPLLEGVEVKAATEGAADFAVSDGGHLVYALGAPEVEVATNLVAVARDGSRSVLAELAGIGWHPRFSPDGSRVALAVSGTFNTVGSSDLWVIDATRGARTRVTFGGNNRFYPLWTPDGSRLTHADGAGVDSHVLLTAADGSGVPDTLPGLGGRSFPTSWSPDGRAMAYFVGPAATPSSARDIWVLRRDADRADAGPFVATPFMEAGAIFSPDGDWIAYVSDKSGQHDVYARPFPGPGSEVTLSVGGGREPVWSRSGSELYYRHEGDLMAVSVAHTASSLTVGTPRRVFADVYLRDAGGTSGAVANYDISPSGATFLMVERAPTAATASADGAGRLHLVLNWLEELRARIPS